MAQTKPRKTRVSEDPLVPVRMTARRWQATAAILTAALSITEDPVHATLIKSLSDEIQAQAQVTVTPVEVEDDE
jgi:hypothetical protein